MSASTLRSVAVHLATQAARGKDRTAQRPGHGRRSNPICGEVIAMRMCVCGASEGCEAKAPAMRRQKDASGLRQSSSRSSGLVSAGCLVFAYGVLGVAYVLFRARRMSSPTTALETEQRNLRRLDRRSGRRWAWRSV